MAQEKNTPETQAGKQPAEQTAQAQTSEQREEHPEQPMASQEPAAKGDAGQPKEAKGDKKKSHAELAAQLAAAQQKADDLKTQLDQTKETLMRTAAEYDNFRKRSAREKEAAFGDGVAFAVEKLLGVLDTLNLAANIPTQDENYKKGVVMTLDQCAKAFEAIGVEEIQAQGLPFDPQFCAAVMQQPAPEGTESGTVTQVLQKGYTYKGKVVRHASVAVAE